MESMGQNMLMNMIIRPPRASYPDDSASNNTKVVKGGKELTKKVFTVLNAKGEKLSCTLFDVASEG